MYPAHADPVAYLARSNSRTDFHDLANRFVAEYVGKLNWDHAMDEVYVGVAEAAGVNFDNDLIGAGLGGLPLFYFPLAV